MAYWAAQPPNMSMRRVGKPAVDARQGAIIQSMYQGSPAGRLRTGRLAVREDVAREMDPEMEAAGRNALSARGFELEAQRIARLMADRYTLEFVDVGGWDTHVGARGRERHLAGRLEELGRGAGSLCRGNGRTMAGHHGDRLSEFGRTFRENGNRGIHHGHRTRRWLGRK